MILRGAIGAFKVRVVQRFSSVDIRKGKKKLTECAELFQICLGYLFKKVGECGVAIAANEAAVDVVGNSKKGAGAAGVNRGGKSRIAPDTAAQRWAKGRVVDVFVFFKIRHKKFPLKKSFFISLCEEGGGSEECRVQNAEL